MENEDDFMSIFDSDIELNMDYNINDDLEIDSDDEDKNKSFEQNNNDTIDGSDDESQEEVDSEDDEDDEGKDDESSPNLYSSIATALYEQGILPSFDSSKKIETVDDFVEQFNVEIDRQSELKIKDFLSNLDLEKIAVSKKELIDLDSINEDYLKNNLDKAKDIIYQDYLNQGLSEDRAKKLLKKTIDLGEEMLIEESLESIDSLKSYNKKIELEELEKTQKRLEESRQEQIQNENKIKEFVFNSQEIVKGIPNTKVLKEKVYKTMLEPVAKNHNTGEMMNKFMYERSQNPLEFDIKMHYLFELTNGFKDISNISNSATTKSVKKLETVLRKTKIEDTGIPNYLEDPDSYSSGFGSELVL